MPLLRVNVVKGGPFSERVRYIAMLRRLIYVSRSMIGADPGEMDAILSSSIRQNTELEVTGVLWAHADNFAQVIEGAPDDIGQTMDRIRADRRHSHLEVLLDRPVLSRQFGDWSMRLAADDASSAHATAFMIGFAMGQRTASAKRLYEIVLEGGGQWS